MVRVAWKDSLVLAIDEKVEILENDSSQQYHPPTRLDHGRIDSAPSSDLDSNTVNGIARRRALICISHRYLPRGFEAELLRERLRNDQPGGARVYKSGCSQSAHLVRLELAKA